MKETLKNLRILFFMPLLCVLLMIVAFESGLLPVGVLSPQSTDEFILLVVMELALVLLIPLSLKLFKFKMVIRDLMETKEIALRKWWSIRIIMLMVPLVVNTILYYLYMSTTFGYMAIILFICMAFVYPDKDKCYYETRDRE